MLAVRGEVQEPQACLLSCEMAMPEVYVEVPTIHQVSILNQTLLPTYFEWGKVSFHLQCIYHFQYIVEYSYQYR